MWPRCRSAAVLQLQREFSRIPNTMEMRIQKLSLRLHTVKIELQVAAKFALNGPLCHASRCARSVKCGSSFVRALQRAAGSIFMVINDVQLSLYDPVLSQALDINAWAINAITGDHAATKDEFAICAQCRPLCPFQNLSPMPSILGVSICQVESSIRIQTIRLQRLVWALNGAGHVQKAVPQHIPSQLDQIRH
jgi:hypothetical protein